MDDDDDAATRLMKLAARSETPKEDIFLFNLLLHAVLMSRNKDMKKEEPNG